MEETVTIVDYKDMDDFKNLKSQAWNYIKGKGNFSIDDMQPAEYKYFDKLLQTYGKLNNKKITKEEAIVEDNLNYAQYVRYKDDYTSYMHSVIMRQENYRATQEKLSKIEKSKDRNEIYDLMAECMSFFLVDESFSSRQLKK